MYVELFDRNWFVTEVDCPTEEAAVCLPLKVGREVAVLEPEVGESPDGVFGLKPAVLAYVEDGDDVLDVFFGLSEETDDVEYPLLEPSRLDDFVLGSEFVFDILDTFLLEIPGL